jgi:uncharacterized protein YcbK (DUF882 family)
VKLSLRSNISEFEPGLTRRRLLHMGAVCSVGLVVAPTAVLAKRGPERALAFHNLHTGESLKTAFRADGDYVPEAMARINQVLRDHRSGEVGPIDPRLLDLLYVLRRKVDSRETFHVISGYRSPATNDKLRRSGRGVAKNSFHTKGMAIDVRLPGRHLADLRKAALTLRRGGVGYYPNSNFVHVDTGPVRRW